MSSGRHPLPDSQLTPGGWREVPAAVAARHLDDVRLVDVRENSEFNAELGHVKGAELVPLSMVQAIAHKWDRKQPVLLVCRSGGRSAGASRILRELGFETVYNLTGGMLAWNQQGLPVERS